MARHVLITGGARGIGRAIALRFAQEGANISLCYNTTKPDAVLQEIAHFGGCAAGLQGDVSDFSRAEAMVKEAQATFGIIDVLVNNAGITRDSLLMRMSEADFDAVIETNLKGCFNMLRHVSPIMLKARKGTVINMASVVGLMGNVGQVNYAASKAGIIGMTKAAARELSKRGVTCNAVAPGFIETDMTAALPEEAATQIKANIPLGRYGSCEGVAELVYFLSNSPYITGQVIAIDGGMSI